MNNVYYTLIILYKLYDLEIIIITKCDILPTETYVVMETQR